MRLKITVNSIACDTPYGGVQYLPCERGEYRLDDVFRLPFFRVIVDDVIEGALCFRLKEGGPDHFFVLEKVGDKCSFYRETSTGEDEFIFETEE